MDYLLRGILIGLLFGLPVGAVGTMTVRHTWNSGIKAGLFTGLGSSVADCFYAVIGAFGITFISDFLLEYQVIINILGGGFILYMGIRLLIKKDEAIGTYIWWGTLTAVTNIIKKRTKKFSFQYMNRIFGIVLCLFGIFVLLRLITL